MKLSQAFDISPGDVAAFVGAGGKTALLVGLGYELAEKGWRVLATATMDILAEQLDLYPHAMPYDSGAEAISQALNEYKFVFLYDRATWQNGVVSGPQEDWARELLDSVDSDVLLVEADRADGLPFKAPYDDEPRIPSETSLLVPVVSLSALGKPLNDEHIYNPQAMIQQYGFKPGSPVKSPWLAQVLRDDDMGLKNAPPQARVVIYINRAPAIRFFRARARMIARLSLLSPRVNAVAIGAARGAEPIYEVQRAVGAIVLAIGNNKGDAKGNNQPEMLVSTRDGKSILTQVTEQLIRSRIAPIRVVAGRWARAVRAAVKPLGVKVVTSRAGRSAKKTPHGRAGFSKFADDSLALPDLLHLQGEALYALKAGLRAMPAHLSAVLVVQGDQPRLKQEVIHQIMASYARGSDNLLIPSFEASLGQPVLIGRRYWSDILSLPRKGNLRDVFAGSLDKLARVEVSSDTILCDARSKRARRTTKLPEQAKNASI